MGTHWLSGQLGPACHYADSRARWGEECGGDGGGGVIRRAAGGAAVPAFVHAPFSSTSGPRKTGRRKRQHPGPPVPAAPPSAQRSWTDQPQCGEHRYFSSFSPSCAVLDGAVLKVRSCILVLFLAPPFFRLSPTGCQLNDLLRTCRAVCADSESLSALVAHQNKPATGKLNCSWF